MRRHGLERVSHRGRVWRAFALAVLMGPATCMAASTPALTDTEMRWLQSAWPVLLYARSIALPVDVVVQPQSAQLLPPMALAWVGGRCKFVLSLRDNPEVPATEARLEPELFDAALQLMAAHELGHCSRHVRGEFSVNAGAADPAEDNAASFLKADASGARGGGRSGGASGGASASRTGSATPFALATQREEAYADLVGLAWTQRHHPKLYGRVHAWLVSERVLSRQRGPAHDTLAWAHLASRAERFGSRSVFAEADALWVQSTASAD